MFSARRDQEYVMLVDQETMRCLGSLGSLRKGLLLVMRSVFVAKFGGGPVCAPAPRMDPCTLLCKSLRPS